MALENLDASSISSSQSSWSFMQRLVVLFCLVEPHMRQIALALDMLFMLFCVFGVIVGNSYIA